MVASTGLFKKLMLGLTRPRSKDLSAVPDVARWGGMASRAGEYKKQGAYAGQKVYDHTRADHSRSLEGPRGGERGARRGNAEPTAPAPAAFGQVGDFYGGDYCAPTQHAN